MRHAIQGGSGLWLTGAKVHGALRLDYVDVTGPVILRCAFDSLSAQNATFKNVVDLRSSVFEGGVDLVGATFDRVLRLDNVEVKGKLGLWATRLRSGLAAHDLCVGDEFFAEEMNVAASAAFENATFRGAVTFRRAHVAQTLSLEGAHCHGEATFNGATVADIKLIRAHFAKDVYLRGVHVGETLRLHGARFSGDVSFDECQVRDLELGHAKDARPAEDGPHVHGAATFRGGTVRTLMTFFNTRFHGDVVFDGFHAHGWRVSGTTFDGSLTFRDLRVERSMGFFGCKVGGQFVAENLRVAGTATFVAVEFVHAVTMTGARFGSDLRFRNVRCWGMDLSGTDVAARLIFDFEAPGEAFVGRSDTASCSFKLANVSVAQDLTVGVPVDGELQLIGLNVQGSMILCGLSAKRRAAVREPAPPVALHARFLTVARDLTFTDTAHVAGTLDLTGAKVAGTLQFQVGALPRKVVLNAATLGALSFQGRVPDAVAASGGPADIDLDGCVYDSFDGNRTWLMNSFHLTREPVRRPTSFVTAWPLVRTITGWSTTRMLPSLQPFLQLEKSLRSQGNDADANVVFFEGSKRTRWKTWAVQWWPQSVFTGYGVKPLRLALAIVLLWAFATAYFAFANGAVRELSVTARTEGANTQTLEERKNTCGQDRANGMQAALLAVELFVPTPFPDRDLVVVPACRVTIGSLTLPLIATSFVVFVLKLGGLILIPLAVVIVSGVLRPSAKA